MEKLISTAKKRNWKICLYGLGILGSNYGQRFVTDLGISVNYYCDKNVQKFDELSIDESMRLSLNDIMSIDEDVLVITAIGYKLENEVVEFLSTNKYLHVLTWSEICNHDSVIKEFLGLNDFPKRKNVIQKKESVYNKANQVECGKIAIYTCITGRYDTPPSILFKEDNCDYYLITDDVNCENKEEYIVLKVDDVVPKTVINAKDRNRYCKMHGYDIFPEYQYSIYLDGNLQIYGKLSDCINYIGDYGLAIHKHPFSEDPYSEAVRLVTAGRISEGEAKIIAKWLYNRGIPRHIFYLDCNVIVSKHGNICGNSLLKKWWNLYNLGPVKRDQFYMACVLYENNVKSKNIGLIPGDVKNDKYVKCLKYH